jgi:hypothetical protein
MNSTNRKDITKEQEAIYAELNHRGRDIQIWLTGIIELLHRPSDLPAESEIKVLNHMFAEIELQANHISETIVPEGSGIVFDNLSASHGIIRDTKGATALLTAMRQFGWTNGRMSRETAEELGKSLASSISAK